MSKEVILAAALGYDHTKMHNFVASLRKTAYQGEVIFLISHNTPIETTNYLLKNGIRYIKVQNFLHFIPKWAQKYRFSRKFSFFTRHLPVLFNALPGVLNRSMHIWSNMFFHHIALSRYAYYYQILTQEKKYEKIFLTDVRDVIFQDNPFNFDWKHELYFFLEDAKYNLFNQNYIWMQRLFGDDIFKKMGQNRVICSGTTYGTRQSIVDYCLKMCVEQTRHIHHIAGADGFDQGVHEYLIYENAFKNYALCSNFEGPVLTMHGMSTADIKLSPQHQILDCANKPIPVLHQYDRHPHIAEMLIKKYT